MSTVSDLIRRSSASDLAMSISSSGVKLVGIKTPTTCSLPRALTRSLATRLLSIPPLSPMTLPSAPAALTVFQMKVVISSATASQSRSDPDASTLLHPNTRHQNDGRLTTLRRLLVYRAGRFEGEKPRSLRSTSPMDRDGT